MLLSKLQNGSTLKEVAKEYGATIRKFSKIVRNKEPKAPLTFPAQRQIFQGRQNDTLKLDINDGFVIGEVTSINLPDADKAKKEIAKIVEEAGDAAPQEIIAQYIATLSQKYKVKINERVLQTVYGSPVEN